LHGFTVPAQNPVQPMNLKFCAGVAVIWTIVPQGREPLGGDTDPEPAATNVISVEVGNRQCWARSVPVGAASAGRAAPASKVAPRTAATQKRTRRRFPKGDDTTATDGFFFR
jgi:hypothetical protein